MFKSYIKTAFRNLWRGRTFTLLNLSGLALGMAVFLLIFEYIAFEWGANRFHQAYDRLYRTAITSSTGGTQYYLPPGFPPLAGQQIPAIEGTIRVADGIGGGVISARTEAKGSTDKSFREEQMLYVDGNFLQVLSFPLREGSASLSQPHTLALSESMANKLLGKAAVAGSTVMISDQFGNQLYTVNAVFKDMPENSDIKTNILLSLSTLENPANRDGNDWADPNGMGSAFVSDYLLLKAGANERTVAQEMTRLYQKTIPEANTDKVVLQAFQHLHLAPSFDYPYETFGSRKLVFTLLAVSVLILCIAWINYINLSTVQALKRARETGVRKVLGASALQLQSQYLAETLLLTCFAALGAVLLVQLLQPVFNSFTGKHLSLAGLKQGPFLWIAMAAIIAGTLLSGGYVAFVLSSFKPASILRGKGNTVVGGLSLRKSLVVFQFTISILFIIATVVLFKQLRYMKTGNTQLKLEQLLVIKGPTVSSDGQAAKNAGFKNALAQLPYITKIAASNNVPGQGYNFSTAGITRLSPDKGDEKKNYKMFICDNHYFDTYGIPLVQGSPFSEAEVSEGWNKSKKIIINEKAAEQLGFRAGDLLAGKKVLWNNEFEIVGVVKNYNHLSLHKAIDPVIFLPSGSFSYFTLKTSPGGMPEKIREFEQLYKSFFPGNPFDYFFADEAYNRQYQDEQQLGNVFTASAIVAVFIACLGLFGLAAFTAQQRIKEIGIRKVLGASVGGITQLLSKDFMKLVLLSIAIATPLAWWGLQKWLANFAYRTKLDWWVFVLSGAAAILIAFITVSFQAIKAATMNPVKNLRAD